MYILKLQLVSVQLLYCITIACITQVPKRSAKFLPYIAEPHGLPSKDIQISSREDLSNACRRSLSRRWVCEREGNHLPRDSHERFHRSTARTLYGGRSPKLQQPSPVYHGNFNSSQSASYAERAASYDPRVFNFILNDNQHITPIKTNVNPRETSRPAKVTKSYSSGSWRSPTSSGCHQQRTKSETHHGWVRK